MLVASTPGVRANGSLGKPVDITGTTRGAELVQGAAPKFVDQGIAVDSARLRAWEIRPGEYVVGETLPRNLAARVTTPPDGRKRAELTFDVGIPAEPDAGRVASADGLLAATPTWSPIGQSCFQWIGNGAGELLSCYKLRKLVGETSSRDFYSLEQYGTVQATPYGRIYDGWVAAVKASASASMAWEDWDPIGDLSTGNCMIQPLSISILGSGFSTSGLLCERWDMTLYRDAGHFKQMWSCGCIWPFGQPYPNSRGMRYVQGISVAGGGSPWWTLSAGFTAL
ncbi:MAG: hypothetical protein L0221_06510 [Chloroflexi bacterium]|nr:hypothetical protein [Chloroflexota bacterium]